MSATYGQKLHATSAGGHLYTEMKPEHATDCSLRRDQKGGKNQANPLSGGQGHSVFQFNTNEG